MKISILEYLGLVNEGVLMFISIVWNEKYYEGTFYYTDKDILLTVSDDLEKDLGHSIKEDENYVNILREILRKMAPYEEVKTKLNPVDFKKWKHNI
jgi:hypothetical protein